MVGEILLNTSLKHPYGPNISTPSNSIGKETQCWGTLELHELEERGKKYILKIFEKMDGKGLR